MSEECGAGAEEAGVGSGEKGGCPNAEVGESIASGFRDAFDQAVESGELSLAREVMRALARMQASEAVPALRRLLQATPWLRRSRHRALQRLAIETLARLPGSVATWVLEECTRRGHRSLRPYARKRLSERAGLRTAEADVQTGTKAEPLQ